MLFTEFKNLQRELEEWGYKLKVNNRLKRKRWVVNHTDHQAELNKACGNWGVGEWADYGQQMLKCVRLWAEETAAR